MGKRIQTRIPKEMNYRELERTNDPRYWIAKSRIRYPKKLGPSRIVPRGPSILQLVNSLCNVWRCYYKDQIPTDELVKHWVDWSVRHQESWFAGGPVQMGWDSVLGYI